MREMRRLVPPRIMYIIFRVMGADYLYEGDQHFFPFAKNQAVNQLIPSDFGSVA